MTNIILITHNDLDGVFCGALASLAYPAPDHNVTIYYCGYDNVNERVQEVLEMIKTLEGNTVVYVTDISVKEEIAEMIDAVNRQKIVGDSVVSFCLLDHHGNDQVMALNKYCWATVKVFMDNHPDKKTSGTKMFFEKLLSNGALVQRMGVPGLENLRDVVDLVRKYDTWEWVATNDEVPNKLNTLFKLYPRRMFVEVFSDIDRYETADFVFFNEIEETIIALDEEKKKSYIKAKMKEVCMLTIDGKCAGVVMAEQYINDVAHEITARHQSCDLAVVVTSKTLSFRTDKEDVNVALIARKFGGNGHPKAAGAQISEDIRNDMLSDLIFMLNEDKA